MSAGDVERFVYCAHNWWLAKGGVDGEDRADGVTAHRQIGEALHEAERRRIENMESLRWAFRVLLVAGAITVATIASLTFDSSQATSWMLVTTGLVLLNCSVGLLTIALYEEKRLQEIRANANLMPGAMVEDDLVRSMPLLDDPQTGLRGRPDYVMETSNGDVVPIEVKTGRTPRKPHESHVMQVAAYLHLLDVDGRTPRYGMVSYPDGSFRIPWDADVQGRLLANLERMAAAVSAGKADRDHQHAARCRGCARRAACDQRID